MSLFSKYKMLWVEIVAKPTWMWLTLPRFRRFLSRFFSGYEVRLQQRHASDERSSRWRYLGRPAQILPLNSYLPPPHALSSPHPLQSVPVVIMPTIAKFCFLLANRHDSRAVCKPRWTHSTTQTLPDREAYKFIALLEPVLPWLPMGKYLL